MTRFIQATRTLIVIAATLHSKAVAKHRRFLAERHSKSIDHLTAAHNHVQQCRNAEGNAARERDDFEVSISQPITLDVLIK